MKKNVKEEMNGQEAYKVDKLSKIPSWLIFLLLKYWAAAAAVFFSAIGGLDIGFDFSKVDETDPAAIINADIALLVFIGMILTLIMNYIVRPIARMINSPVNNTYKYNMINCKGILSFFLSLLYYMFLSVILFLITIFLSSKKLVLDPFGTTGGQGVEPFTYALCFIVVDFIFLVIKNLILYLHKRIKYNREMKAV